MGSIGVSCAPTTRYDNLDELILLSTKPPSALPPVDCLTAPPDALKPSGHVSRHTLRSIRTTTSAWISSSGLISTPLGPLPLMAPRSSGASMSESDTSTSSSKSSNLGNRSNLKECDSDREAQATRLGNNRAQQLGKRIDMLLVFIGMLLGATTSLLVNAASSLRPEPSAAIIPILKQSFAQLRNSEVYPYPTSEVFVPDGLMVMVNSLYALGIVICLAVAFSATFVKLQLPGELDTSTLISWRSKERALRVAVNTLLGCAALAFLLFLIGLSIDKIHLNLAVGLIAACTTGFVLLLPFLFTLLWARPAGTDQALEA